MPGPSIGIGLGLRERGVDEPPFGMVDAVVRRRTDERVAKLQPVGLDVEQSERLHLAEILLVEPERAEGAEHHSGGPRAVRRGYDGREVAG